MVQLILNIELSKLHIPPILAKRLTEVVLGVAQQSFRRTLEVEATEENRATKRPRTESMAPPFGFM